MFNSIVLDVVIGLVFIYLLYSLLTTTIMEIIATRFSFRAKILERAIFRMLEDESKSPPRIKSVYDLFSKKSYKGLNRSTVDRFYEHPLMKFLSENNRNSKPSYIKKETFSKIMVDLLRGDEVKPGDDEKFIIQNSLDNKTTNWGKNKAQISEETLSYINSLWADSQGDVRKFRALLETWFDATMERATGWYKKNTQFILFFVGMTIAIVFNVDTIKIVGKLENDPKIREQMVQQADNYVKAHPDLDKQLYIQKAKLDSIQAQIAKNNLSKPDLESLEDIKAQEKIDYDNSLALKAQTNALLDRVDSLMTNDINKSNGVLGIGWNSYEKYTFLTFLLAMLGWVITAVALSLGAPFWFDLLNKLMKLRGSVASNAATDKQKNEDS